MVTNKIKILYLDDEENNLYSFKSSFRKDFKIFTAKTCEEAIEILDREEEIHVLITDQRMPKKSGVQFLEEIKETHPNPIRLLLTGYSDIEAVIAAINDGQIFKYITKPWNEHEIKKVVLEAYNVYEAKVDNDLFVYRASHDLKGPLASIEGLIGLVKMKVDEKDEIYKYINLIDTSVIRVQDIMQELMDYKKLKELSAKIEEIDLISTIEGIKDSISHMKNFEHNEFDIQVNGEVKFFNDQFILNSIVQNLVSNSIKYGNYSENNTPKVSINASITNDKAKIVVTDNGIGMKEEAQKNVFKMFYRENTSSSVSGTGLGMFITKKAIDKIGGEVSLKSKVGEGSSFTVEIPNRIS